MGFRIEDLQDASLPLGGSEVVELEQAGSSRKVKVSDLLPGFDDALRVDLADQADTSKGSRLVAWLSNISGAVARWVSEKLADQLSFKDFGIVGDGSDETVKLQAAFAAAAGKVLRAEPGKIYFTTDELLVPSGAEIDFCGSQLNYTIAVNGKNCIRFKNTQRSTLRNVTITPVGVTLGDHGGSRMPVCIGEYGNTFGNTPNRDILLENVSVVGGFDAMNAFAIFGDTARVRIVNPQVIGTAVGASAGIGILVHWSANNTGAPTTTYHPNNIQIINPYFEKCALGTAQEQPSCIFLSGTHNVSVTNMVGDDINTGVYVYPGDFGYTYARASDGTAMRNIDVSGFTMKAIRKFGVYVLGQANGVGPSLPMGVTVRGGHLSGGNIGVRVRRCADGVSLEDTYVSGANTGVTVAEATDVKLGRLRVVGNTGLGVYLSASSRCTLRDSLVRGNNTSGLTNQLGSAVYFDGACADNAVLWNHIGADVATEYYGVRINGATVVNTKISGNTFYNFTTNVAIQNDAAPYSAKTNGSGNVFAGSSLLANPVTPPILEIDAYGKYILRANAAPTTGTWRVGDRAVNSIPAVGSPKAWSCTVAGTPGTWVSEGNL